jgi:hypothetical protein
MLGNNATARWRGGTLDFWKKRAQLRPKPAGRASGGPGHDGELAAIVARTWPLD